LAEANGNEKKSNINKKLIVEAIGVLSLPSASADGLRNDPKYGL
jgi:hypothetical protein